jgi:hypothetical protein
MAADGLVVRYLGLRRLQRRCAARCAVLLRSFIALPYQDYMFTAHMLTSSLARPDRVANKRGDAIKVAVGGMSPRTAAPLLPRTP